MGNRSKLNRDKLFGLMNTLLKRNISLCTSNSVKFLEGDPFWKSNTIIQKTVGTFKVCPDTSSLVSLYDSNISLNN